MKVLIVGDWHSELHEEAVYNAFIKLGHQVVKFPWNKYFKLSDNTNFLRQLFLKAQNKYITGPLVKRMNIDLIALAEKEQPDVVFIYRGSHIYSKTLRKIRRVLNNTILVGYNNDDPFSTQHPRWLWRHFLAGVPEYDLMLAYRRHNIDEFKTCGAKRVELLRSWFIPERNYPVKLTNDEKLKFECDVVFVGHYEDDGRLEYLENIVRNGWKLRIFGPGYDWDPQIRSSNILRDHIPIDLVWGKEYNLALNGASVALCFFSKLNRDTYTRRCFEIPASETVMLSEYSDDLAGMFEPDQEAVYFRNDIELQTKLELLLTDKRLNARIASAGMKRVWTDRHDVVSRFEDIIKKL